MQVTGEAYTHGIESHERGGVTLQVYGVAKTVADRIKHRNKIGMDVALRQGLPRRQRDAALHGSAGMSAPGRPKREYRSAQHEGTPVSRDRAASVRARLLNFAKATSSDFDLVLVGFVLERLADTRTACRARQWATAQVAKDYTAVSAHVGVADAACGGHPAHCSPLSGKGRHVPEPTDA